MGTRLGRPYSGAGGVDPQTALNTTALSEITGQLQNPAGTYAALPTIDAEGDAVNQGDYSVLTQDDIGTGTAQAPQFPAGFYRFESGAYVFKFTTGSAHVADAGVIFGTVDGDALLAPLQVGQAYHFQAAFGDVSLTSATEIGTSINGDLLSQGAVAPLVIPEGVQGFITKNATGGLNVSYSIFEPDPLDLCGINEFIHNIGEFHGLISHEGGPGNSKTVRVNGVGATFQNLENATDAGNGVVQFAGGTNQVFDRNASTVETVRDVGGYFEIVTGATGQFDGQRFSVNVDPTVRAFTGPATTGQIQILWGPNGYTLFDPTGANVSSGSTENGTYRFTRTLYGWEVSRNGGVIYTSPEVCEAYPKEDAPEVIIDGTTGFYRLGQFKPATPINTSTAAAGTDVITGLDLTQAAEMSLRFTFVDQSGQTNQWATGLVDVDQAIDAFNAGSVVDSYIPIFDNDWMRMNIVDPATGEMNFVDQGRDMALVKVELWVTAEEQPGLVEVQNIALAGNVTTGTFQNFGDPDPTFTGENGAVVFIEYGDNNRDRFTFLDGAARAERKGLLSSDIEIQIIAGGQIQIRDNDGSSGVTRGWYQYPIKAIGLPAQVSAPAVLPDPISDFAATIKVGQAQLSDGRAYTILEDNAGTVQSTERTFNSLNTPFVEIEVVRDQLATHGPMLRANSTGGRQSQLRFNLINGTNSVANSGADTALPAVLKVTLEEKSIKYLVQFNDLVAHTELEISPAAHDAALTANPASTGQTGVLGVKLYDANPL